MVDPRVWGTRQGMRVIGKILSNLALDFESRWRIL